jgi:hypothetical protein
MSRYTRRLLTAVVISSACFLGTHWWYVSGQKESHRGNVPSIAQVERTSNEVQRKPLRRVIWEGLTRNDELYPGEAIRTAANADAEIRFKSGTTVHLDPDSLIVLEQNDKGLSLDFLQGNMFVQSTNNGNANGKEEQSLTLKSGQSEIKLKSADMSLTKALNGNVSLEVHRGEAELEQGNKKTALTKDKSGEISAQGLNVVSERVQILHPQAGETLYLNLTGGEHAEVGWRPLAPGYTVKLELGLTRRELTSGSSFGELGEKGRLAFVTKPGRWYLRLVATNSDAQKPKLTSLVVPFVVEPKSPPLLLEPRDGSTVLNDSPTTAHALHWSNRHSFTRQRLEIATNDHLKAAQNETLEGDATTFSRPLAEGTYFWRVTGYLDNKPISSAIGKFQVANRSENRPPVLINPLNNQKLSLLELKNSPLPFKWETQAGVDTYHLKVEKQDGDQWSSVADEDTEGPTFPLADLAPGTYRWQVASQSPNGGKSKSSVTFQFVIADAPKIEWLDSNPRATYIYNTPKPSLEARWRPFLATNASYRFMVVKESAGFDGATWQATGQTMLNVPLDSEGAYVARVEALDSKKVVVGQSSDKVFVVQAKPLLPAPQWTSSTPTDLKSNGKGDLTLHWEQVEGAEHYLMVLESPDGQVVDQQEISRNIASLKSLKPGDYNVYLKAVDSFKRSSADSDKRKLHVPQTSDIRAPKIKAMKVK